MPSDPGCRRELALADGQVGEETDPDDVRAAYDAVRLGEPERALGRLPAGSVFARHADALARGDGAALDRAAEALAERELPAVRGGGATRRPSGRTGIPRAARQAPVPGQ